MYTEDLTNSGTKFTLLNIMTNKIENDYVKKKQWKVMEWRIWLLLYEL